MHHLQIKSMIRVVPFRDHIISFRDHTFRLFLFDFITLVPPSLISNSNETIHRPTGGTFEFVVSVSVAYPPITADDLLWSGNFGQDRQTVSFKNNDAILTISDLVTSDTGNVTLTVKHLNGNVSIQFGLMIWSEFFSNVTCVN